MKTKKSPPQVYVPVRKLLEAGGWAVHLTGPGRAGDIAGCLVVMAWILLGLLLANRVVAQGNLVNGGNLDGTLAVQTTDSYAVEATVGDRIVLQIAKLSGGAGFTPRIELLAPDGASLATRSGALAARIDIQAAAGGSYTVRISDASGTGAGTYRLQLAQIPGVITFPPGEDGGPLSNGARHQGTIEVGDLDMWTVSANQDDRIVVQIGELLGGAGFTPRIELFAPDGARLGASSGALAGRIDVQATRSGVHTVLVSDATQTGAGSYEVQLAQVPGSFAVPSSDEGGMLTDAQDHDGAIDVGDLDLWSLTANAGDHLSFQLTELTGGVGLTPRIELLGPDGAWLGAAQGAASASLDAAIEVGGAYTVLVSDGTQSGAGTYRLRLIRTSIGVPAPNVLTNGATHLGSISGGNDTNFWTFSASAGQNILLRVGELSQSGTFTVRLRLLNPSGVQQALTSGATAADIAVRATNSGTFTLSVDNVGTGSGTYRLTMAKTGSNLAVSGNDEGGTLTNGTSHVGSIDTGDLDAWTFTANVGDSIVARMGEITASLTPQLRLYGPSGALLDSAYGTVAAEVVARATNSGTFLVVAGDQTSGYAGTGNYRLTLAKTASPVAVSADDEGGALTSGATHVGSIDPGDLDSWTFMANVDESVVVRMGEVTAGLAPQLRLYGPGGALLDSAFGAVAAEVTARATDGGTFLVVADDRTSGYAGAGTYRLTMVKTASPLSVSANDEGGALTNGTTHAGSIDAGDIDAWAVTANAGDSIVLRMGELTPGLTPQLRLYGPNGALLDSGFGTVATEVTARATNGGTFLVVAGDQTSGYVGTGGYRLSLAKTGSALTTSPNDEGGLLANGAMQVASVDLGDLDAWTFSANAGESVVVRMGELSSGLTPQLRLYGPTGQLLDSAFGTVAAEVVTRAADSGSFLVVAGDQTSGYAGTGNYRLSLTRTGHPLATSANDEGGSMTGTDLYDGAIEVGDLDSWTFSVWAGDTITINLAELVSNSPLSPSLRLYGRDGVLLRSVFGAASTGIANLVAPASGTYTVVVGDQSSGYAGAGTYRLTVNELSDGLKLRSLRRSATDASIVGIGGVAGAPFVLLTTVNVAAPLTLWTAAWSGEFDEFGMLDYVDPFDPQAAHRFFYLHRP